MALYLRSVAHQARAADAIYALLGSYPEGVTLTKLMLDNPVRLKDVGSVYAALTLLQEEGKVTITRQ
jgi:hypothetical protein